MAIVDHLGTGRSARSTSRRSRRRWPTTGGDVDRRTSPGPGRVQPQHAGRGGVDHARRCWPRCCPAPTSINPKLVPQVNTDLLESVEATSTSPLTIQYVINPKAVWSDGVPVTADDFIYAWQSQRGDGIDVDGQPDQVASTLGYRDVASVTGSNGGRTVTVVFATPFADWRVLFDHMVPGPHRPQGGVEHTGSPPSTRRSTCRPVRCCVQSVSPLGNGGAGPEPVVVGDTGRCCRR